MGILLPCRSRPCHGSPDSSDHKDYTAQYSEPPLSTSLASQPSLPSVPSLQLLQPKTTHQNDDDAAAAAVTVATIAGAAHSSYISALVLAGKFLFSASSDGTVRLWPRHGHGHGHGHQHRRHYAQYNSVAVSNSAIKSVVVSGDKLFTAHQDHKIRVWKTDRANSDGDQAGNDHFKCVATLPTLSDRVSRLFSAKNYVTVRRHVKRTWVHHNDAVSALAVSRDGSVLYSASWDRTFKVWRAADFKCLESVADAHDDAINAIALADDGHVYTGSADRRIKVWKRRGSGDGRGQSRHFLVETLEKHRSAVNALATSDDGRVLYSGARDRSILVWERQMSSGGDGAKMAVVGALRGHSKAILSLAVVAELVCSGSADCSVRVWKRSAMLGFDGKPSYACLAVMEGHRRPVKCLSLGVDHNSTNNNNNSDHGSSSGGTSYLIYSGGLDCEIKLWKISVPS